MNKSGPGRPSEKETELARLMVSAQNGDREDYMTLLKTCEGLLSSSTTHAFRRLGLGADEVPDVVQEILCAIHAKRATFDPSQAFLPWMFAIAHYKIVDHFRRRHTAGRYFEPIDDLEHDRAIETDTEEAATLDWEKLAKKLPEKQRTVVQMVKIDGLSVAEAAEKTGYSPSDIKVTVHRALKALGDWVKENDG